MYVWGVSMSDELYHCKTRYNLNDGDKICEITSSVAVLSNKCLIRHITVPN